MAFANTINNVNAIIASIPAGAAANGRAYNNTAQPTTSHVRPRAKWLLQSQADGSVAHASFEQMVCYAGGLDNDNAHMPAEALPLAVAVTIAIARLSAARVANLAADAIAVSEAHVLAHGVAALTVHVHHQTAVTDAVADLGQAATRLYALLFYNGVSLASCNHHHLPAKTKKLATTTMTLTGLGDLFAQVPDAEGMIMHDTFHPVSMAVKSEAARSRAALAALNGSGFSNLAKRIPVKAPDTGVAMNYATLYAKARDFPATGGGVPNDLAPPAPLAVHIAAYIAADAAHVQAAVATLVADSSHLGAASTFIAGYLLGKTRRRDQDTDLSLAAAGKSSGMTILGAPALQRLASEYPGTFSAGVAAGYAPADQGQADQNRVAVLATAQAALAQIV